MRLFHRLAFGFVWVAGIAGKSTNLYTYAINSPILYQDPTGELLPAVIAAGAVIGAVTNAAIYAASTAANPTADFSWGGLAGAAVSGGITGAGVTIGATLGGTCRHMKLLWHRKCRTTWVKLYI